MDLTVQDGARIRDSHGEVVGWRPERVEMDGDQDSLMNQPEGGACAAGICHARGPNADLPVVWLVHVSAADLERSAERCTDLGGEFLVGPTGMGGHGRCCVIRDPAAAISAPFEPAADCSAG